LWELIKGAVGEEAGVHAVHGGVEPVGDTGQAGDDLGALVQGPADLEVLGVVRGWPVSHFPDI